ncbi:MAG: hypothetical protein IH897_12625, partial [Planctomycetes bacterium]|nr:hypothetical protein [Planctomycetota bacterium]
MIAKTTEANDRLTEFEVQRLKLGSLLAGLATRSETATEESVTAIGGINKKIAEMDEITTVIASAIEEQGAATGEIS